MLDADEFPGHELFSQGIADLLDGRTSEAALLVSLARTRLIEAGFDVPPAPGEQAGHQLYDLLASVHPESAHGRYNALLRRMESFARAAEHAASR